MAAALASAVGQMAFRFGFVHGDLHPGNLRVLLTWRPVRLSLLDPGLYAELPEAQRVAYCALWRAVALGDGAGAAAAGAVLLPGSGPQWALMAQRPERLSRAQRGELRAAARLDSAADVADFLAGVPPAIGVAFRAQGLLRHVTMALGLPRDARLWHTLTEATVGMHWRDGQPPRGVAANACLQLDLVAVRCRFLARVVRAHMR